MKRTIYSAAMLLALLSTACGSGNKEASELPQIDVNTNYPEKEICLQDVADVIPALLLGIVIRMLGIVGKLGKQARYFRQIPQYHQKLILLMVMHL